MKKIKNIFSAVKNKLLKLNLKSKINIFYIVMLIVSLFMVLASYNTMNSKIQIERISKNANQTLDALDENLGFIMSDVSQFSNYIFFNNNVQSALKKSSSNGFDVDTQTVLDNCMTNIFLSGDYIDSIYLYDNYGNFYSRGKKGTRSMKVPRVEDAPWYNKVVAMGGKMLWVPDSGGLLNKDPRFDTISLVRVINDENTFEKVGILVVDVEEGNIRKKFDEIGEKYRSQFFIMDSKGNYIIHPQKENKCLEKKLTPKLNQKQEHFIQKIGNENYLISFISSRYNDWKIVGAVPISELSKEMSAKSYILFLVMVINIVFLFLGAVYTSNLIAKPLVKMKKCMKKVKNGRFELMEVEKNRDDEIVQLKRCFNKMIIEIEDLIQKVEDKQRTIRKNELNLLRAQINPHFLYNTLDAISALAFLKDNKRTITLTQSLGNFYRISLSSGQEVISVREEIDCIKNYLTILDIRYKGKFDAVYDIQEKIYDENVLKLILQPFVENSIHHGIRNKQGKGRISIKAFRKKEKLVFIIEDNGIGMNESKIKNILNRQDKYNKNGFGIYNSLQRISIFYNIKNPVRIYSSKDKWTKVVIIIPIMRGGVNGRKN